MEEQQDPDFQLRDSEEQSPKLTDWKNPPTLQNLKRDLEAARSNHAQHIAKITHWNDLRDVTKEARPAKVKGRSSVQPKLIRRQAEWRYSALTEPFLGTKKIFKVDPATWADVDAAKQNDLVLNWQFRTKLNRIKFIDDYVRACVDDGTCIVRVGWKRTTVPITKEVPVWDHYPIQDPQSAQALQQALAQKDQDPRGFESQADPAIQQAVSYYEETQQPTVAQQTGTQQVETEEVLENKPTLEILWPENVYIDPSCNGDLDKAMFGIISFETCKADLLKEPAKYKNLDSVMWNSNSPATEPNHATTTPADFALYDKVRHKVVAYEYWGYWDIEGEGKLSPVVITWIGDTIIRMELNPYPDEKIPLVVVPYMPRKRELYGEADAELLEDNQKVLGAVMRGMIDLLGRSANGQQGMAKGMLDPLNRKRYENGEDYEFNPGVSPANGIIEHKFPELPQSAIQITQIANEEAEALTGVKSFSGGLSGSAYGDVATGIKGAMDAAAKREMAILRRLAQGMVEIGTKILAMNALFMSEEETVQITEEKFVQIKREDLKGNFQLEVDINTAEVDNAKSQDLAFMVQTCGPNVGPDILLMILSEIADLKRMPALAHKLKNYKPPPPSPEQQQLMQLQLQEAQLKVQLLQSQIQLNGSRAQLEGAKAEHTGALKDKTNLDYVEQETGTSHLREMQKVESQARSNQNLEVTKALLKARKPEESKPDIHAAVGFNQISGHLMNQ
jgi:hypothetical protein